MNQVTLLRETLRPHLAWHGARLSFLAAFLIALFRVKTINFSELATGFSGKAQTNSHYKRLQRFFRHYEMDYAEIAQTVVALMAIPEPCNWLQLLYESRARVAEFCNLCWKDIREKTDGSALVTLFGKGSKTRKVTISPHLWQALKATKLSAAKGDDPIFTSRKHRAYSPVQIWRIVRAAGERVGIYEVSPHWIRHSGATHQLINGSPIHLQQQELGHSGLDITSRYLHMLPGEYGAQYCKVQLPETDFVQNQ